MKHVPPSVRENAFNCPYCHAFAHQDWFGIGARLLPKELTAVDGLVNALSYQQRNPPTLFDLKDAQSSIGVSGALASKCTSCDKVAIWINNMIVFPEKMEVAVPNPDTPEGIRLDYEEAGAILNKSPRGAAALIRLAIQKLCKELGQPGRNINDDISALVKAGLDPRVQQALDAVRVIGNSAVHPGQIDLRDDRATAETLFKLFNLIIDKTISEPKHVAEVYASLPEGAVKAIEKRDGQK